MDLDPLAPLQVRLIFFLLYKILGKNASSICFLLNFVVKGS